MDTSGTQDFSLTIEEIIHQAFGMVGGELTSGEDLKIARTKLNMLLIDMQNKGHPLAELELLNFTVTESNSSYTLNNALVGTKVIDVLSVVTKRDGLDTPVKRIPLFEYHKISDKSTEGLPNQFALDRDRPSPVMYLYQTPENSTDEISFWALTQIEDAGSYTNTMDISNRYYPAVMFGLAYYLSFTRDGFPIQHRQELRNNYLSLLGEAQLEDRERVSYKVTPPVYHRRR